MYRFSNFLTKVFLTISLVVLGAGLAFPRQSSPLSSGQWHKIAIVKKGIYKIDKDFLEKETGLNLNNIDPSTFQIYSNGNGGMLPQANSIARRSLEENAILVTGESDGKFDNNDLIIFYGNGSNKLEFDPLSEELLYEKNIYSDTSFYFLTYSIKKGKRIDSQVSENVGNAPVINSFDDFINYEKDAVSIRSEGRQWHDYQMFVNSELSYDIDLKVKGINNQKKLSLKGSLVAVSTLPVSFDLSLNGEAIGNIPVDAKPPGEYSSVGVTETLDYELDPDNLPNISEELNLNLTYNLASGLSNGYLDYFLLEYSRDLKLYEKFTFFRSLASKANNFSTFEISLNGSPSNGAYSIWNVSDPVTPVNQEFKSENNNLSFTQNTNSLQEFVIFDTQQLSTPVSSLKILNQDILSNPGLDGIIVTHPLFLSQAKRLAEFHRSNDQLKIKVVTTEEVYNEFSSGASDITAIRDYAKKIYEISNKQLKYLTLFGDCSYDYKKRFPIDNNFVPVYQARESLHPIFSYSSDDYFGFFEEDEGEWLETQLDDNTLEIGVGRLPAKTIEEARVLVDKVIRYASGSLSLGDWKNKIYFIADDGDSNIHQRDAERLSDQLEREKNQLNPEKIYLDAFEQIISPDGERSPNTAKKITDLIEEGALIINYTGHGNTRVWTDERVLDKEAIKRLSNRNRLPLFITATCQFGKYDDPIENSGGEELLLNPNGGAIALLTTTRPVFSNTNFVLNRAFYDFVFKKDEVNTRLGDIIKNTKNASLRGSVNRNFALLGDPMLQLNVPEYEVSLDEIKNTSNGSDTVSALSLIKIKGSIRNGDQEIVSDFNGEVITRFFDKNTLFRTLGNENSPFDYKVRNTILFNGKASVKNGLFEVDFIIPKNIAYNFDAGKVSFYATTTDMTTDASGANNEVIVGGSVKDVNIDITPPEIEAFLNDDSFKSGQTVTKDPLLLVKLTDESGINISNRGFGQNLTGVLNDTLEILLNDYYTAATDTYKEGWITFPFRDLPVGKYELKIKVWDVHNNLNESTVQFVVTDKVTLNLSTVYNYPNPLNTNTTFLIEHDREGEELLIDLNIFSLRGQLVHSRSYRFDNPNSKIDEITWNGTNTTGAPLENGVYIYNVKVQSTTDGAKNEIFRRLVISK